MLVETVQSLQQPGGRMIGRLAMGRRGRLHPSLPLFYPWDDKHEQLP
jgi:hypothetical protein